MVVDTGSPTVRTTIRAVCPLVPPLRNHVADAVTAKGVTTGRIAVALVQRYSVRPLARSSSPLPGNTYTGEQCFQPLAVARLPGRDHRGDRPGFGIGEQMYLGRQPSAAASERMVAGFVLFRLDLLVRQDLPLLLGRGAPAA
jgi:hypothetical protein